MAELTFYTVAMSRGQISRWALHEAGADYEHVVFDWASRPETFKTINPMNKVPTLVHHHGGHDHVVTECAAINHYLAETHPQAALLPDAHEKAAYFRWLFFAAGPLEQALVGKAMGWEVPEGKTGMAGFGSLDLALDAIDGWLSANDYAAGNRFTMADTYVGPQVRLDPRAAFVPRLCRTDHPAPRLYRGQCDRRRDHQGRRGLGPFITPAPRFS